MSDLPKYAHYKESGVEWLGEIPNLWEINRLKFLLVDKLKYGANESAESEDRSQPRYIRITDIDEIGNLRDETFKSLEFEKAKSYLLEDLDILLARSGATVGKSYLYYKKIVGNACYAGYLIRARLDLQKFNAEFVNYFLQSKIYWDWVKAINIQATIQNISAEKYSDLILSIPPLEEQNAIVSFLDKKIAQIDTLISKQEMLLEKLAEQRIALISHAVTKGINPDVEMKESGVEWLGKIPSHWKFVSIKHLTQVKRGASPRPIDNPEYFDDNGEYAWVRIADVTNSNKYLIETTQRLSQFGSSFSVKLQPNSIFLSIAGSVGKPIITQIKVCIHDGFVYFPDWQHSIEFLYYIFESGQPYLGLGKLGTQLNLNTDTVGNIKIGLPSLKEQKAIVSFLDKKIDKINCTELSLYECITKLKEYRSALITQAVTGKIDVRNLNQ